MKDLELRSRFNKLIDEIQYYMDHDHLIPPIDRLKFAKSELEP